MIFRKLSIVAVTTLLLSLTIGCNDTSIPSNPLKDTDATLNMTASEPRTLDPSLSTQVESVYFIQQLFVGLTVLDEENNVIPSLARTWKVSDDGLVWTYTLRNDVHWVNRNHKSGELTDLGIITATDVVYGILRTLDPNTKSVYASVLHLLKGAKDFSTAKPNASNLEQLKANVGIEALDDTTVQFTLNNPATYFPSITSLWATFPLPKEAIEKHGDNWIEAGNIVTSGSYMLNDWKHGDLLSLVKNPLWPQAGSVQIDVINAKIVTDSAIVMAMYENNEIDLISSPPGISLSPDELGRVKTDPIMGKDLFVSPGSCTHYFGFMNNKPPFNKVSVRKAFSAAINRQQLIKETLRGGEKPAHSFAPLSVFGNVVENTEIGSSLIMDDYNKQVKQAKQWLADAGYAEGDGIEVNLIKGNSKTATQIGQVVQRMWKKAFPNAKITLEQVEWSHYPDRLRSADKSKHNIFLYSWCSDYPDSNNWLNDVFHSNSSQNFAQFNHAGFDEQVEAAASESNSKERLRLYANAERILIDEESAIAPLYYSNRMGFYKPWLKAVISPTMADPIQQWKIDMIAKHKASETTTIYQDQPEPDRDYAADWAKWAFSIPTSQSPLTDAEGANCSIAQAGSVWFLGGNFSFSNDEAKTGLITRTCTLPENTKILLQMDSQTTFDTPNVCGQKESRSYQSLFMENMEQINNIKDFFVEVDGERLDEYYLHKMLSRNFTISLPEENVFDTPCAALGGVPAGNYTPAHTGGFYAFIPALSIGTHTLRKHSVHKGKTSEMIYHLTVVPQQ